jgi:hypothetical protein
VVALAYQQHDMDFLWTAVGSVTVFALLDAYYLGLERRFRDFYHGVAAKSLDHAADLAINGERGGIIGALGSFSVWGFYGPQLLLAIGLALHR